MIVNADTKLPFQEHVGPDGKVYAEVEPGTEYFIQLEVVGGNEDRVAYFQTFVDDNKLNQYFWSKRHFGPHLEGLSSFQNGVWTKKSFHFRSPDFVEDGSSSLSASAVLMGSIKIQVSEGIYLGTHDDDFKGGMTQEETQVAVNDGDSLKNKTLRTVAGKTHSSGSGDNHFDSSVPKDTWEGYVDGALLEEINIHYCTALGLIHAGILPKPPIWDFHRLKWALPKDDEESSVSSFPCDKIRVEAVTSPGGGELVAGKEYELWDLTGTESDVDKDDENESDNGGDVQLPGDSEESTVDSSTGIDTGKDKAKTTGGVGGRYDSP